jgi:hypothetical protein
MKKRSRNAWIASLLVGTIGLAVTAFRGLVIYGNICCGLGPKGGHAGFAVELLIIPIVGLLIVALAAAMFVGLWDR